ncbi:MAG: terminase family protein, partial [Nanoarchaeota archaeon]
YLLWYALFNKDKLIAIVADKEKTSKNILSRIKTAYSLLPLWLQQGIKPDGWNAKSVSLENGSTLIISSTTGTALTGESISLLYIDEFAKIPSHLVEDFMDSVFPTIESNDTSKIIIVSTPKGLNHWHKIWKKAMLGENDFFPIKINWREIPGRDDAFKKSIIRNHGLKQWKQEYEAVFLGSSSTLIDSDILEQITIKDPIDFKIGYGLKIYEYPIKGCRYILGVDTAKGTGKDFSVIQVIKITNRFKLEQVAVYASNTISTTNYAQVVIEVSKYYKEAEIMIDNNDIGDGVANNIWHVFEYDKIIKCDKKGIGIRSTKKSKLEANLNLKKYLEE